MSAVPPAAPPGAEQRAGSPRAATPAETVGRFKRIAEDLFALEVNTILKANMTATKMPARGHALLDLVSDYDATLASLGAGSATPHPRVASRDVFDRLRTRANDRSKAIQELRQGGGWASLAPEEQARLQADLGMLCRICENSDLLKEILSKLEARAGQPISCTRDTASTLEVDLLPGELVALRKCWELGTEQVVMQTVIHLDGDVISRVHPLFLEPSQHAMFEIHQTAVTTSVKFWAGLVKLVGNFARDLAGVLLG